MHKKTAPRKTEEEPQRTKLCDASVWMILVSQKVCWMIQTAVKLVHQCNARKKSHVVRYDALLLVYGGGGGFITRSSHRLAAAGANTDVLCFVYVTIVSY